MSPDSSYTPDSARLERGFWIAGGCSFIRGRKIVFGVLVVASALIGVWALALRRSPSLPPVGQLAPVTVNAAKGQTVTTLDGRAVLTVRDIEYRKDKAGFWMTADVKIEGQPPLTIEGKAGSKFWDKGRTVQIALTALDGNSATLEVSSLKG